VLDKLNPQVASRQMGAFNSWKQYDEQRQTLMKQALTNISEQEGLSPDVYEIVTKYLAAE
jgi:aminopeptidase N